MNNYTKIALAAAIVSLAGCAAQQTTVKKETSLPNPASVFCIQQGGQVQNVNTPAGQAGYCQWPDGQRVEEWTYFREHHKETAEKGGLVNPAAAFCVKQGGKSDIVESANGWVGYCQFSNGQRVEEWKYFHEHHKVAAPMVGLANPASVFCVKQGGKSQIVESPKGWVGYCQFSNGQRVNEWKYFREHHSH